MDDLKLDLRQSACHWAGCVCTGWGRLGFAFRTAAGRRIFLDPYLSDSCERLFGFKRLSLPALRPEDVEADWVVLTHEHADHLDPDAIPVIARNNPACRFAAPAGCMAGLEEAACLPVVVCFSKRIGGRTGRLCRAFRAGGSWRSGAERSGAGARSWRCAGHGHGRHLVAAGVFKPLYELKPMSCCRRSTACSAHEPR